MVGLEAREERMEHYENSSKIELEEGELLVEFKEETEVGELVWKPVKRGFSIVKEGNTSKADRAFLNFETQSQILHKNVYSISTKSLISSKGQLDNKFQPQQPTNGRSQSKEISDLSSVKTEIKMVDVDINWVPPSDPSRRFSCTMCENKFKSNSHLTQHMTTHMSTHTGIYPFNCSNCQKGFNRRNKFVDHTCNSITNMSRNENKQKS